MSACTWFARGRIHAHTDHLSIDLGHPEGVPDRPIDTMRFFKRWWCRSGKQSRNPLDLIPILLDKTNDLGSRDDIAMDLGEFDLPQVEAALVRVASDATEEEMVIDSAGESLWQIYERQRRVMSAEVYESLQPSARKFFRRSDGAT